MRVCKKYQFVNEKCACGRFWEAREKNEGLLWDGCERRVGLVWKGYAKKCEKTHKEYLRIVG